MNYIFIYTYKSTPYWQQGTTPSPQQPQVLSLRRICIGRLISGELKVGQEVDEAVQGVPRGGKVKTCQDKKGYPSIPKFGMYVWYGMVWYGMVWYGMVWYGIVCMYVCMHVCMYICMYHTYYTYIYSYMYVFQTIFRHSGLSNNYLVWQKIRLIDPFGL